MYFVSGIQVKHENEEQYMRGEGEIVDKRCFGYFDTFDSAKEAIEKNYGDMNEAGYYKWLCIEEIGQGIHADPIERGWWCWKQTGQFAGEGKWIPYTRRPKFAEGYFNWAGVG